MRLLTHNYLISNVKGTTEGYPLIIEAASVKVESSPVDRDKVEKFIAKINYATLVSAVNQLSPQVDGGLPQLPDELPEMLDDSLVADLHHLIFDVHILEGYLVCPATGRKFPVKDGIPNMILHEDEI